MKAKTIDNRPHGWDAIIYHDKKPVATINEGILYRKYVDECVEKFNSALSSHVAKETEQLQAEIDRLKSEVEKIDYAYNSLAQKYNNAVEEVERLNGDKWISVKENLPKTNGEYVVHGKSRESYSLFFRNGQFGTYYGGHGFIPASNGLVTHWQPLPQPK